MLTIDFGIRKLWPQWRQLLSPRNLKSDLGNALITTCFALPFALAVAMVAKVDAKMGLIAMGLGGIVGAVFSGSPSLSTAPSLPAAVLIAMALPTHGLAGAFIMGLGCAILQLTLGITRSGRWFGVLPLPAVWGFTAGVGILIFVDQLPLVFGLPIPEASGLFPVIGHVLGLWHSIQPGAVAFAMATFLAWIALARTWLRGPALLLVLLSGSFIASHFELTLATVGEVPRWILDFPTHSISPIGHWTRLITLTLITFIVASKQTKLSAYPLNRGKHPHPSWNQDLLGQGLANLVSAFMGGIPVAGTRPVAPVSDRRVNVLGALFVLAATAGVSPWLSHIPLAALAGLIMPVALGFFDFRRFSYLAKFARAELVIYLLTLVTVVLFDPIAGMEVGLIASLIMALVRVGQTQVLMYHYGETTPRRVSLAGPITYFSAFRFQSLKGQVAALGPEQRLIIDATRVTEIDASGAQLLMEFLDSIWERGTKFVIKGMPLRWQTMLQARDPNHVTDGVYVTTESEVTSLLKNDRITASDSQSHSDSHDRLAFGVALFRRERRRRYEQVFQKLANSQAPHSLFITCSDSRINPNLFTSTDPGELFLVRNVGNIVPPFGVDGLPAEGAAVEYALGVLRVNQIIICGHTGCGAMNSLFAPPVDAQFPSVGKWLADARNLRVEHPEVKTADEASRLNVLRQLQNLRSYPIVQQKEAAKEIRLRGWLFDVGQIELLEWDENKRGFFPVGL